MDLVKLSELNLPADATRHRCGLHSAEERKRRREWNQIKTNHEWNGWKLAWICGFSFQQAASGNHSSLLNLFSGKWIDTEIHFCRSLPLSLNLLRSLFLGNKFDSCLIEWKNLLPPFEVRHHFKCPEKQERKNEEAAKPNNINFTKSNSNQY